MCHITKKVPKDIFRNVQTKKIEKGPNNAELGLIVTTGEIQAQSQTDHVKMVARGTHPGCGCTPGGSKLGPSF